MPYQRPPLSKAFLKDPKHALLPLRPESFYAKHAIDLRTQAGVRVERLEVWHNEENARLMRSRDRHCGGVPFFYNDETRETLCGEVPYSELKKWALGLKG